MFTGSMYGSGPVVFAMWAYVLAHVQDGLVELNPALLAAIFGCTIEEVEKGIAYLCAPDSKSRSPTEGGRRLKHEGAFLYTVVNWELYRKFQTEIQRRAYHRDYMREKRRQESKSIPVTDVTDVTPVNICEHSVNTCEHLSTFVNTSLSPSPALSPANILEAKASSSNGKPLTLQPETANVELPVQEMETFWNGLPRLGAVHRLAHVTAQRLKHLKARWQEPIFRENWQEIFRKADTSDFLIEQCKPFDFTWVVKNSENYVKILEGKYDNLKEEKHYGTLYDTV